MVGTGGIAERHLEVLSVEPGVEIAGFVSGRFENARRAAGRWGGRPYQGIEELLHGEDIDAAWVTVPPHAHGEIERALVARRVPFFVEKPLSADRETARGIAAAISEADLVTAVGYQWRALDTLSTVREALSDRPPLLVLASWQGALPGPAWWRRREQSGGQMVEQATHLFDLARLLAGEARVLHAAEGAGQRSDAADADVPVASVATLRFEGGALGSFSATSLLSRTAFVGLQFFCEGLLVTVTREGVSYEDSSGRRQEPTANDPIAATDRAFLQAVKEGDSTLVLSSYADAMKTHELLFDVAEASGDPGSSEG